MSRLLQTTKTSESHEEGNFETIQRVDTGWPILDDDTLFSCFSKKSEQPLGAAGYIWVGVVGGSVLTLAPTGGGYPPPPPGGFS